MRKLQVQTVFQDPWAACRMHHSGKWNLRRGTFLQERMQRRTLSCKLIPWSLCICRLRQSEHHDIQRLENLGVYMVTNGFGFTMKYLQLSYYRLLRGNLAPGQEASVRSMLDTSNKCISLRMFRSHLLRALERYALAMRTPNEIVPFPVDDPTSHLDFTSAPMTFEPSVKVRVLSFDGHFGLHRPLNPGWGEKDRSVRVKGRPRKKYNKDQRSCTCADKSRQRVTMKNRTAGWQFVIDPQSRQVLAAKEHEVNECLPDKVAVVEAAMKLKKVKADAIIHDDACHFEAHVHRHQGIKKRFRTIKHFIVDEFHRCNHKCKKCKLTPSEKRRFKGVRYEYEWSVQLLGPP